jgi:hypothetical protein
MRENFSVRWIMGWMEKPEWQLGQNMLDPDHDPKCRDVSRA